MKIWFNACKVFDIKKFLELNCVKSFASLPNWLIANQLWFGIVTYWLSAS